MRPRRAQQRSRLGSRPGVFFLLAAWAVVDFLDSLCVCVFSQTNKSLSGSEMAALLSMLSLAAAAAAAPSIQFDTERALRLESLHFLDQLD